MPDDSCYSLTRDEYLAHLARRAGTTPDEFVILQREHVLRVARSVLAGTVSVLAAARELSELREIYPDDSDADLLVFIGVASQIDHLPIDDERRNWSTSALAEKDFEIAEAEHDFRPDMRRACERIVARFGLTDSQRDSSSNQP